METVVKAQPRDVIALVWYQLGYRPRHSLVVLALHGRRRRSGVVTRVDLLPATGPQQAFDALVGEVAGTVRRSGASAVIVLVIDDDVLANRPERLMQALDRVLRKRRLHVVDVVGVDQTAFRSLLCANPVCCPPGGVPLETVQASEVAAALVLAGRTLLDDEQDLIMDVLPDTADTGEASTGAGVTGSTPASGPSRPSRFSAEPGVLSRPERRRWWGVWSAAFATGQLPPDEAPGFGDAMRDPLFRDAVMVSALGAPMSAAAELISAPGVVETAPILGPGGAADLERLLGVRPGPDEEERLERARAVLAAAARGAPPGRRADSLATLAWLAWYEGNGGRARLLADRAREDCPSHSLAQIVTDMLLAQTPPLWIQPLPSPRRGRGAPRAATRGRTQRGQSAVSGSSQRRSAEESTSPGERGAQEAPRQSQEPP